MEALKRRRSTIKGSMTRISSYVNQNQSNIDGIKVRIHELDNIFVKYNDLQDEIDALCSAEDEIQMEDKYRSEIEEVYFATKSVWSALNDENSDRTVVEGGDTDSKSELNNSIRTIAQHQSATTILLETITATLAAVTDRQSSNSSSRNPTSSNHQSNTNQSELRLPAIQIPDFEGDLASWVRFKDLFVAMVDSRSNLSDVEKLEYLQSKLRGEPSSMIKHLTPTNDNYKIAWEVIVKKYDRPEKIKRAYFDLLFERRSISNSTLSEIKQFYNNLVECYNALIALNEPVDSWDSILLYLIEKKLDTETITLWYRQQKSDTVPTFKHLLEFLDGRVNELENLQKSNQVVRSSKPNKLLTMTSTTQSCPICNSNHFLYNCPKFLSLNINERQDTVRKNGLCFNCLKGKHFSRDCKSSACKTCKARHNTLLHVGTESHNMQHQIDHAEPSTSVSINSTHQMNQPTTLLPTAIVMIKDRTNKLQPCRALIDSGAQSTLISEACAQRLQLERTHDRTLLYGVGGNNPSYTKGKIQLEIFAKRANKSIYVQSYCLSNLTQYLPSQTVIDRNLDYFKNLQLADPAYNEKNRIDIILGADVFAHCVLPDKITHPLGSPTAINTIFGWILMGNVNSHEERSSFIAHVYSDLDFDLQKFWEVEECKTYRKYLSPEEEMAEQHYKNNVKRQEDGRYVVRLPFKSENIDLGESRTAALKRLQSMERKFDKDENLRMEFHKFMAEYIDLHHMEKSDNNATGVYYMPHHAVLKPTSTTTKLRVVFDASCKTSNNYSLNDHLLVGPVVQNDLYSILLKFRVHRIGIIADIEKMYRQVLVHPDNRSYQRILWRSSPNQQPVEYNLRTVTYGTAAAPFLATRTLQQIALENAAEYPHECREINDNFYVDDYMTSAPDLVSADMLRKNMCTILSCSGFNLRKWSTNSEEFHRNIPPEDRAISSSQIIDSSETVKILGLLWNTTKDCFQYSVYLEDNTVVVTKRTILSNICKIYDPVGWLAPVVIIFKIFMQRLWLKGLNWDQDLTPELKAEWSRLRENVHDIKLLQIPRWLNYTVGDKMELHGFADSSELAYAAAIYVRILKPDGSISTRLLTSNTRVAPIKQITLPRLELCAAQLMVKLMTKVRESLNFHDVPTFGWTDSTVVLAWIGDHPRRWKTFIANRTSYIIQHLPAEHWRHIPTTQNAADLATRGTSSTEVIKSSLWWEGPAILQSLEIATQVPSTILPNAELEERKVIATVMPVDDNDLIRRFSEFNRLVRITSLILRFFNNCKTTAINRKVGSISTSELIIAHDFLVRQSQQTSFQKEINTLSSGKSLTSTHILASLIPFVDEKGNLRVGGRLNNANINYDQKHPYILHKDSLLTELIIKEYHLKYLHAGTRQLQYLLALKYWIPGVIHAIKRAVYKCPQCMRFRQKPFQQRMGDLPTYRLQPGSPFLQVGIDFAGPLQVKSWKGRGSKSYKCWIAVFVCLNTKAIHLEAVTDLSTSAFLATLRRFTSRRGKPLHIFTDNGTNFVGGNQQLKELYDFLNTTSTQDGINKETSDQRISWHFIPPSAPNFGGIWEAGVKSVKFHLKRVLGNSLITYEELSTLLCQVECCLNSRPLCLKFEGDPDPLTPAHFLILRPMTSIPDENVIDVNVNRLTRWQYIQRLIQQFWSKWSKEYISQLQKRPKWVKVQRNLEENDIIIVKDDNLPPTQWLLGRVIETHPGQDGIVRVVTVRTKKGCLKRPVSKLCPLFIDG